MSLTMRMQSSVLAQIPFFSRRLEVDTLLENDDSSDEPPKEKHFIVDIAQFVDSLVISAKKFVEESLSVRQKVIL